MEILRSKSALRAYIERNKEMGKHIGFAPTMGALHEGHLALYKAARQENDLVVSSIFVNPTQFNNAHDLEFYPRTLEADLALLEQSKAVDAVYIPKVSDLYPEGLVSKSYEFDGLENKMEGEFRPGHFNGVATVVETLLTQVRPNRAYFGEKDFQQLRIIQKLVAQKQLPIQIVPVPILREKSGLAMSSRNERLSSKDRKAAKLIHETLIKVDQWFRVISIKEINERVTQVFEKAPEFKLEYFSIADEETLEPTDFFYMDHTYRAFIAVHLGGVRLIDTMHLE